MVRIKNCPVVVCLFQVIVCLLVLHCLNANVSAGEYYVAPHGSNSNPGTQSLPWKTIAKAAATLVAGDTVYIEDGTYRERLIPASSGSPGQYITYQALNNGQVILDGATVSLPDYDSGLVQIEGRSYIRISGLMVMNVGPNMNNCGMYVNYSDNIILENNTTYNTVSSGIGVWDSTNVTVDSNVVELACNDGEQECITIAGTDGFTVKNNHVHSNGPGTNGGEGIDIKDGSANGTVIGNRVHDLSRLGIYVEAWDKHTHTVEVSGNRVYNCQDDGITLASEMGGLLENIRVVNNVVTDNRYNGISITPNGEVAQPPMRNLQVINNTVFNNGDPGEPIPWGGGISVDNPNIDTLVIRNNIFSNNLLFQILIDYPVSGLSVDHNLVDGFRGFDNEIKGSSVVEGNPLFLHAAQGDFHLTSSSPAIDRGSSVLAPADDYDLVPRPQGSGIDIGAFEYEFSGGKPIPGVLMLLLQ